MSTTFLAAVRQELYVSAPARLTTSPFIGCKPTFLKTELEPGHCLRLPAEGPCECELMLTCPKILTTSEYAPKLRARLDREEELMADAQARGWPREVERHQATQQRIKRLLTDLDKRDDAVCRLIGGLPISGET